MFYSDNVLTRKGPLANIWLAAHWDRKLTKSQIVSTNIESSVDDIVKGALPPMALRLSGQLLLGASRIYWRKARYLLEDCSETLDRLKLNFKTDAQVDLTQEQARAPLASITLSTNYTTAAATNLLLPEPELDLDEILNMVATQPAGAAMKSGNDLKEKFSLNKSFANAVGADDSLLQAFPEDFDNQVEMGRRLTDLSGMNMSRDTNPFLSHDDSMMAIEAGRRESVASSTALAFSPMRLKDQQGVADLDTWDAPDAFPLGSPLAGDGVAAFSTPEKVAKKSTNVNKKRKVALDEVTELSSTQIQKQVKDTSDILLGKRKRGTSEAKTELSVGAATVAEVKSEVGALLSRPAFEGDLIMDTFGELFRSIVTESEEKEEKESFIAPTATPMKPFEAVNDYEMPLDNNDMDAYDAFNATITTEPSTTITAASIDIISSVAARKSGATLQSLIAGQARGVAAKAFFDVLAQAAKGQVKAVQSTPFGEIKLMMA